MPSIVMSGRPNNGQNQPGNIGGYNAAQLQALSDGATGSTIAANGGSSSMTTQWMSDLRVEKMLAASRRTGTASFPGAVAGGSGRGLAGEIADGLGMIPRSTSPFSAVGKLQQIDTDARIIAARMGSPMMVPGYVGANAVGGGIGIPSPPGGPYRSSATSVGIPAFMGRQQNQGYGGGGGLGGGGGGSGGYGGGHGGGGYIPFAGALGFGNTGALLGAGLPRVLIAEMAAKSAEELILAPQKIGGLEMSGLSSAQKYIDLTQRSYASARARGGSGESVLRQFFPGGYQTPPWMQAAGIGPTEAEALSRALGVQPRTSDLAGVSRGLASSRFLPGLSGMDQSDTIGSARNAAKYGLLPPTETGVRDYMNQLSITMENATMRGMDRTSFAHSIDAMVSQAVQSGGAGISTTDLQNFMMRFSDLPGGKTGEAALQVGAGLGSAMSTVGSDPMRSLMASRMAMQMKTPDDVKKLLGDSAFSQLMSTPEGKAAVQNLNTSANKGEAYFAMKWLDAVTQGNPAAQAAILGQPEFLNGIPQEGRDLAVANLGGMTPMQALAMRMNPQSGANTSPTVPPFRLGGYDDKKKGQYAAGLRNMGVREDLIGTVLAQAQAKGIDPLLLGGVMMQESSGGHNPGAGVNVMQIDPKSGMPMPTSAAQSIEEGATHLQGDILRSHGDFMGTLRGYNGPRMLPSYAAGVARAMAQGGATGNVPFDANRLPAQAMQADMAGSAASFGELNTIVPAVNKELRDLTSAANAAAKAMNKFNNEMQRNMRPGLSMPGVVVSP